MMTPVHFIFMFLHNRCRLCYFSGDEESCIAFIPGGDFLRWQGNGCCCVLNFYPFYPRLCWRGDDFIYCRDVEY